MANALTAKAIEHLPPGAIRREIPDGLLVGLYLIVQPNGSKSWAVRYRFDKQPRKLTLGPYPLLDLRAARDKAREALIAVASGRDPISEKKHAVSTASAIQHNVTGRIETVVRSFIERHARTNTRERTYKETERLLSKEVLPAWEGRLIAEITRRDITQLLDGVVDRGAPITANRLLGKIKRLLQWCVQRDLIERSPADGISPPGCEQSRDRILSDTEIKLLWAATAQVGYPFGTLVRVLLLTGQRRDEVAGMRWEEIDTTRQLWLIPRQRVKTDRGQEVPLSPQLIAVLRALPRIGSEPSLVFTTTGSSPASGYSRAKRRIDGVMASINGDPIPHWTFHDLRRTMASGMARLGVNLPVVEKALNHTGRSFGGVAGVYQKYTFFDEMRAAFELWGSHVQKITSTLSEAAPD